MAHQNKIFSYSTCAKTTSCKIRRQYIPTPPLGAIIITRHNTKFCPSWKASYRAKVGNIAETVMVAKNNKK